MPRSEMTPFERRVYDEAETRRALRETLDRYMEYRAATRARHGTPVAHSTSELRRIIERAPPGSAVMFDEAGNVLLDTPLPFIGREEFYTRAREAQRQSTTARTRRHSAKPVKVDCWNEESER